MQRTATKYAKFYNERAMPLVYRCGVIQPFNNWNDKEESNTLQTILHSWSHAKKRIEATIIA